MRTAPRAAGEPCRRPTRPQSELKEEGVATSTSPATVSQASPVFLEENVLADGRMEGRAASTARVLRG